MQQKDRKGFLNISTKECGRVYPFIQQNAEVHFKCAKILARENEHSNAVSHLILGSEELLKALALFLESKDFDLRKIEGFKKIFSNHKARHSIIKDFYSVIIFVKGVIELFENNKKQHWLLQTLKVIGTLAEGAGNAINNYEWWDEADAIKQKCFYVDYDNEIILPANIDKVEYLKALKFIEVLREDIRSIIAGLSRITEQDLAEFRKNFHDANLNDLLGESIKRSSKK